MTESVLSDSLRMLYQPAIITALCLIAAADSILIPARKIIMRLCGRIRMASLTVCVGCVVNLILPSFVAGVVVVKLWPVLIGADHIVRWNELLPFFSHIFVLGCVLAMVCAPLYLISPVRRFLLRYPQVTDALMGVLFLRILSELMIGLEYPDFMVLSYYEWMFPPVFVVLIVIGLAWCVDRGVTLLIRYAVRWVKTMLSSGVLKRRILLIPCMSAIITQILPLIVLSQITRTGLAASKRHYLLYKDYMSRRDRIQLYHIPPPVIEISSSVSFAQACAVSRILNRTGCIPLGEAIRASIDKSGSTPESCASRSVYTPIPVKK